MKLHLRSVAGLPSCAQTEPCHVSDDRTLITCRFCLGILRLRLTHHLRAFTTQEWTRCRIRGNDVWAQSAGGVIVADDDGHVTVTSDLDKGKRYRAHRNTIMLVPR